MQTAFACCLVMITCVLGIGVPTASALEFETVPARIEAVPWLALPPPHNRSPAEGHASASTYQAVTALACLNLKSTA